MQKPVRMRKLSIAYENGEQQIYLNGKNVTALLRKEEVGKMASISSAIPEVRQKLLEPSEKSGEGKRCDNGWKRYRNQYSSGCGCERSI